MTTTRATAPRSFGSRWRWLSRGSRARSRHFRACVSARTRLEIDRKTVLELVDEKFVKGFVVIESRNELDVVAVYTAAQEKGVESIHTERIMARRIEVGLPSGPASHARR
jgi:hypothetical protein